jgi:outer membrane protein
MHLARLALLPLALAAALNAAPAAADPKIAVIRTPVILRDAPQIKAADVKLKSEFAQREKDLQTEQTKLGDDIKKYQRDADSMSAQQRANTEKDLNTRKIDFDLKQRQFSEEAQNRNQDLRRDVLEKVNKAIDEVAKDKGLDLVLQDPAFASDALDITGDVLKKLATYPSDAPAAPAETGKKKKK